MEEEKGRWERETESVVSQDGIRWKPAGLLPLPAEFPASVITSSPILSNSGRTASTLSLGLPISSIFLSQLLPLAHRPFHILFSSSFYLRLALVLSVSLYFWALLMLVFLALYVG